MKKTTPDDIVARQAWQALAVWFLFILVAVIINGTIPFAMGADLRAWTYSPINAAIFHFVVYGVLFLIVPLILVKDRRITGRRSFLIPLLVALAGITLRGVGWPSALPPTAVVVVPVIAYLHWRYDLSGLGVRSLGWRGDVVAILLMGSLVIGSAYLQPPIQFSFAVGKALEGALVRLFLNPASTSENLFYFGFLTERLSGKTGRLTPPLIGLAYTVHEMSNPEYWYSGLPFALVFIGVTIWAGIYMWRRSVLVVWLGDGLSRFIGGLF